MKFLAVVLSIPFILMFLYEIFYPRESALMGKRWQFNNEDLEPSDSAIKYHRTSGIVGLIVVVIFVIAILLGYR